MKDYRRVFLVLVLSQLTTIVLRLGNSGAMGEPVAARCVINVAMIIVSLITLQIYSDSLISWPKITLLVATVGWIFWLMQQSISSRISGQPYSVPEFAEVLILGPIAEELFFRGALWKRLGQELIHRNWILILVGTSVAFGFYHLGFWSEGSAAEALEHVASSVAAGCLFGFIRHRSKGIFWPTWLHIVANAFILTLREF